MVVRSPAEDVYIPEVSVPQFLLSMAQVHGDKVGLINGETGESFTFTQYVESSKKVASALFRRGLGRGDMVAIHCQNMPEFSIVLTGVLSTGATLTLASTSFVAAELERQLKDADCSYLFTSQAMSAVSTAAAKRCPKIKEVIVIGSCPGCTPFSDLLKDDGSAYKEVDIRVKDDVAVVPYSSGTTGVPKGVMLTHYNILANITQGSAERTRGTDVPADQMSMLSILPLYHMYGCLSGVIGAVAGGAKVVYLPKFSPQTFFGAIEKNKIKIVPLVPPLVNFMINSPEASKYDLSSIEAAASGAAPLSKAQEEAFKKRFKKVGRFRQGYGLTETTAALATLPAGEIKTVVDVGTQKELGPRQNGEIWARGPQIMKGYYGRPQATAECLDADGWLHTGDIGYYDEKGLFYIVDRIKELIKVKGLQVAPAELEGILLTHPGILDCAVIGVPDERAGELPKAFIVKKAGHNVNEQQVHDHLKDQVSSYKYLKGGVEFIDAIPRNATGKILRRVLKERVKAKPANSKL